MRYVLAVVAFSVLGWGQDLSVTGTSPTTISIQPPGQAAGRIIVLCEPIFDEAGKWTPHVKNCKLQNGGTLEDVVNSMVDMQATERDQYQQAIADMRKWGEHNLKLAERGVSLAKQANANAMQCSAGIRKIADSIPKESK